MPTPLYQGLSRTAYAGDGVTTTWNFDFAGGYLDASHVKAYTETPAGVVTFLGTVPVVGSFQVSIIPAVTLGHVVCIYRDTPKDAPIVDFTDGSGLSEVALDTNAKQAVFLAAEAADVTSFAPTSVALQAAADAAASALAAEAAAQSVIELTGLGTLGFQNPAVIATSDSVRVGYNMVSAGPLALNDGVIITVPSGSTWTIV